MYLFFLKRFIDYVILKIDFKSTKDILFSLINYSSFNNQFLQMNPKIVSSKWLNEHLTDSNLIILDASQKNNKNKLSSKFENLHIKNARLIDLKNDFSDKNSLFPNTILSEKEFEIATQKLGIHKTSKIVVYDNLGVYTSPRVWWLFKTMGHKNIAVLNGGLPDWINDGYKTEQIKKTNYKKGDFIANFNPENIAYFKNIKENTKLENALVIDARSSDRFHSLIEEPRKELRSGKIANSINIPYQMVLENGKFKSKNELIKLFSSFVTVDKPLIFSCGSGITACILLIASELVLSQKKSIYDGSWTEYAQLEK